MNILDFESDKFEEETWLAQVFARQNKVLLKYKDIEGMTDIPVSIHTRAGQKWIKDFLWRTTEELGESFEALEGGDITHAIEELADSLHFITELLLLVGRDQDFVDQNLSGAHGPLLPGEAYWNATYRMAMVGNTLKNKPWKQTEMPTDEAKFYANLKLSYGAVLACFYSLECTNEEIFSYYTRKNQVNEFRQRSKY